MKTSIIRAALVVLALFVAMPNVIFAQAPSLSALPAQGAAPLSQAQLDQLLAPIALYPDPLLAQILMASTYPLEVVEAARWLQDPNNARLQGDQLDAALQQEDWDPSVKSLVPFPQILQMMNSRLDWTQALGNAFLAQQADVMDSVQRLRAEALAAGTLQSTPQETVSTDGQIIIIEPANPQFVYVPYYDPRLVYGVWGYPDYPPFYFPPPANYGYVAGPGIYFGIGFGIVGVLWGWESWDWGHHDIHIDAGRYNGINNYAILHDNRPRYTGNVWQHDPAHRRGVPYSSPAVRQKFQPAAAGSANARRDFRGFDNRGTAPGLAAPSATPQANPSQRIAPPSSGPTPRPIVRAVTPPSPQRPPSVVRGAPPQPTVQRPAAPAFSSFGRGPDVRAELQRGQASRQSMAPAAAPRVSAPPRIAAPPRSAAPQPQRSAPASGQKGGGDDKLRH